MADHEAFLPDWASPPGETIQELLDEEQMDPVQVASAIGLSLVEFDELLRGKLPLSTEIARLLVDAFGRYTPEFWINREAIYRRDLLRITPER